MNTATDSLEHTSAKYPGGQTLGQSATDLVAFYGVAPVAQPADSAQALIVDGSVGAAAPTNGVLALTGTYNSALIVNALATIIAQSNAMRNALVSVGIIKGGA